ncbi:MAG: hypothetical protein U0835_04555 [Isosphaeraceae bacterium]
MDPSKAFQYTPKCSAPRCDQAARYKIAAPWSNGTSHELKNYGLACDAHRDSQLALARLHSQGLALADGETLGGVGLYLLGTGHKDSALKRLPDHE